jgi:hypothetical protein
VFCCVLCFVCLRPVSCVSNVASGSGLSSSCVLCVQCCQCLWIVFVLCLVCPMLPMVLDCLRPVSCVSNVANGSGLSIRFSLTFIEDNKCVIRSRKLNDIQNHCQHKKDKMTHKGRQNTTQRTSTTHGDMIKLVSDLRQLGGFLRVLQFSPPIKLTATI